MPWCPNCHSEYEAGGGTCYDCDCELVKESPPIAMPSGEAAREAYLMTVADEMEFLVVESKLKEYGIPVVRRHRDGGDFAVTVLGTSRLGLDVYVPEPALGEAHEILEMGVVELPGDPDSTGDEAYAREKPSFVTVLLLMVAGYALINYLRGLLD